MTRDVCEAIVLMGPPGSGKSFLANHLARVGLVPTWRFDLVVDGRDVDAATLGVREFLEGRSGSVVA